MLSALITLLIYILIVGLLISVALYVLRLLPLGEPFSQIARVIVIVIGALIVIMLLLSLVGGGPVVLPRW